MREKIAYSLLFTLCLLSWLPLITVRYLRFGRLPLSHSSRIRHQMILRAHLAAFDCRSKIVRWEAAANCYGRLFAYYCSSAGLDGVVPLNASAAGHDGPQVCHGSDGFQIYCRIVKVAAVGDLPWAPNTRENGHAGYFEHHGCRICSCHRRMLQRRGYHGFSDLKLISWVLDPECGSGLLPTSDRTIWIVRSCWGERWTAAIRRRREGIVGRRCGGSGLERRHRGGPRSRIDGLDQMIQASVVAGRWWHRSWMAGIGDAGVGENRRSNEPYKKTIGAAAAMIGVEDDEFCRRRRRKILARMAAVVAVDLDVDDVMSGSDGPSGRSSAVGIDEDDDSVVVFFIDGDGHGGGGQRAEQHPSGGDGGLLRWRQRRQMGVVGGSRGCRPSREGDGAPKRMLLSTPPAIAVLLAEEDEGLLVSMATTARAVCKWSPLTINGGNGFRPSSSRYWSDQIVRLELAGGGLHGSHTNKICSADFNSYRRKDGKCSRMNAYSEVRWGLGKKGNVEQMKILEDERRW
ncbi:hypothetical protein ACLOJK_038972 [Asimina triloba]